MLPCLEWHGDGRQSTLIKIICPSCSPLGRGTPRHAHERFKKPTTADRCLAGSANSGILNSLATHDTTNDSADVLAQLIKRAHGDCVSQGAVTYQISRACVSCDEI